MAARVTLEQKKYILDSPETAEAVSRKIGVTAGHVRYIRRRNGYRIIHNGYNPTTIDGEPIDITGFDMSIPKARRGREVKSDSKAINNFLYG